MSERSIGPQPEDPERLSVKPAGEAWDAGEQPGMEVTGSTVPEARQLLRGTDVASSGTEPAGDMSGAHARLASADADYRGGRVQEAQNGYGLALDLPEAGNDRALQLRAVLGYARTCRDLGQLTDAAAFFERGLHLAGQLRDLPTQAEALNLLSGIQHSLGETEAARHSLESALSLRRGLRDQRGQADCLSNLGVLSLHQGDYASALEHLFAAHVLHQQFPAVMDRQGEGRCLINIGVVYDELSDHGSALRYYQEALVIARETGDRPSQVLCLLNSGEAHRDLGEAPQASDALRAALLLSRELGYRTGEVNALHGLGSVALWQGQHADALAWFQEASRLGFHLGDRDSDINVLLGLGESLLHQGETAEAIQALKGALDLAHLAERKRAIAQAHQMLSQAHAAQGHFEQALIHHQAFHKADKEIFNTDQDKQIRSLTSQFELERAQHQTEMYRVRNELAEQAMIEAQGQVQERTRELERAQIEIVTRLAVAAEYRDDTTGEHTWRVGHYAAAIAVRLGLPSDQVTLIRDAARLHDVGKIGIPDAILLKPGKLTEEEYEQIKGHTLIGGRILSGGQSELLRLAEHIALAHHERWDGSGYPYQLSGQDIPLAARIVAVADVFDALTHNRSYKRTWTVAEAMEELERQSGQHFDPEVVWAGLAVLGEGESSDHSAWDPGALTPQAPPLGLLPTPQAAPDVDGIVQLKAAYEQQLAQRAQELESAREKMRLTVARLEDAAFNDTLTSLKNRRALEADLEAEVAQAQRHHYPLSVLSLDLDGFRALNDSEGYERGDALLRAFGAALQAFIEKRGRLYRMGGDEYAAIFPNVGPADFPQVLAWVRDAVNHVQQQGYRLMGASAGMAALPEEAAAEGDLLRLSGQRMYEMKLQRRQLRS